MGTWWLRTCHQGTARLHSVAARLFCRPPLTESSLTQSWVAADEANLGQVAPPHLHDVFLQALGIGAKGWLHFIKRCLKVLHRNLQDARAQKRATRQNAAMKITL